MNAMLAIGLALSFSALSWVSAHPPSRTQGRSGTQAPQRFCHSGHYYTNMDGEHVRSPIHSLSVAARASAGCRDGTWWLQPQQR